MKLRIFVIDDEEHIVNPIQWLLEDLGHEVLTAPEPMLCDVYRGCDCKEEYACGDILFVDYHMPRMNGLELIEHMTKRGCKGHPENKIIMTGGAELVNIKKAKLLGCTVIEKPITTQQILDIVEECKTRIDPDRKLADLSQKEIEDEG